MDRIRARTVPASAAPGPRPGDWPHPLGEDGTTAEVWRLRIRLADRPGALARLTIRLADLECNILGLTVLPIPGGVLDEVVVRPPLGLTRAQLVHAIQDEGCECVAVTTGDIRELTDTSASTLDSVRRAVVDPATYGEAVREVLAADLVTVVPAAEANAGRDEAGHRAVFAVGDGHALVARRRWTPFVQLELVRARAVLDLLGAVQDSPAAPAVVTCSDGAALVLREGRPGDVDAVAALHSRCSPTTLFERYHAGVGHLPRRWLHRLLRPPRGSSVLGVHGREVVALGQLIAQNGGTSAEISLLVEDAWQRNGLGTGLLARLAVLARTQGHGELTAVCLPGSPAMARVARRAGLHPTGPQRQADGTTRIRIPLT